MRNNNFFESLPEFDEHNSVFFIYNKKVNLRGFIAFHRQGFGIPSFGATRFMEYENETEALRDALRLSKLMSYKNALAGLPYGGAKGVLIKPKNDKFKKQDILKEYSKHINKLNGSFLTGTDMGLDIFDLKKISKENKNFVGLVNNPEKATALGMYYSLAPVCKYVFNKKDITNLSFAIQGLGKVGSEFLSLIYDKVSKIYVSEIDNDKLKIIKNKFPKIIIVNPAKILSQKVDILCPCAVPNILNSSTINNIKAKAIVGSANNQLRSIDVGKTLYRLGIMYCPDYIVNAGGLIAVADEYQNQNPSEKRLNEKLKEIGNRLDKILILSKRKNKSPALIADQIAERLFNKK